MNMQDHSDSCKRQARQLKKQHPELGYNKRLDLAAKKQGFKHYTSLNNLLKLLGPDKSPSTIQIVSAGGDARECPYKTISTQTSISWSKASPVGKVI
ncbi:hypothetical protein [Colwellia sp. E2M01]|uniref:hypothetical protein n=1 Tax=Colwellia sp. E2M01 TaxID=2841561 RepID=UPI001C094BBA|nr:hypothetical protein [Colwellia sp. E2M01]MBU2869876.1 hypothetical protein [Colwellia sp. E2M01]